MYQRILTDPLHFPPDMSVEAKSVMTGLLQRDPSRRLGANGGEEIKRHPFFARYIDWNRWVHPEAPLFSVLICMAGYWRRDTRRRSSRVLYVTSIFMTFEFDR